MKEIYRSQYLGVEKTVSSETLFKGFVYTAQKDQVELVDGSLANRELVLHSGGVCVLAVDAEKQIYFVRQYRKAAEQLMLELPAGKLEKGEDPLAAAQRELSEETGLTASKWTYLGKFYVSPGYCSEQISLYVAENLQMGTSHPDPGEYLEILTLSQAEALSMVADGKINDLKTAYALMWYQNDIR